MSDDSGIKATIEEMDPAEQAARHFAPLLIAKGVIGIVAGTVLLFWPKTGLAVVAVTLGIFLIADGIERLIAVLRRRGSTGRSDLLSIIGAVLRIIFGANVLVYWILFIGIISIIKII